MVKNKLKRFFQVVLTLLAWFIINLLRGLIKTTSWLLVKLMVVVALTIPKLELLYNKLSSSRLAYHRGGKSNDARTTTATASK